MSDETMGITVNSPIFLLVSSATGFVGRALTKHLSLQSGWTQALVGIP